MVVGCKTLKALWGYKRVNNKPTTNKDEMNLPKIESTVG